jgi:hypothetical protein
VIKPKLRIFVLAKLSDMSTPLISDYLIIKHLI